MHSHCCHCCCCCCCCCLLTVYNQSSVRDDFEEPNYAMIDTLFSLAEAYLFMQLVELVVSQNLTLYSQTL
jgi:hypothetical protein